MAIYNRQKGTGYLVQGKDLDEIFEPLCEGSPSMEKTNLFALDDGADLNTRYKRIEDCSNKKTLKTGYLVKRGNYFFDLNEIFCPQGCDEPTFVECQKELPPTSTTTTTQYPIKEIFDTITKEPEKPHKPDYCEPPSYVIPSTTTFTTEAPPPPRIPVVIQPDPIVCPTCAPCPTTAAPTTSAPTTSAPTTSSTSSTTSTTTTTNPPCCTHNGNEEFQWLNNVFADITRDFRLFENCGGNETVEIVKVTDACRMPSGPQSTSAWKIIVAFHDENYNVSSSAAMSSSVLEEYSVPWINAMYLNGFCASDTQLNMVRGTYTASNGVKDKVRAISIRVEGGFSGDDLWDCKIQYDISC